MNSRPFAFFAVLALASSLAIQTNKGTAVSATAKGTFDVKTIPQATAEGDDSGIGRLLLDKQFHGDLEGVSKGQMLAAGNPAKGSGGYVAIEKVTGSLAGRKGSFVLQHMGSMKDGAFNLTISVVPDSGTDQLAGISGKMNIIIAGGKHSYEFEYSLPTSK